MREKVTNGNRLATGEIGFRQLPPDSREWLPAGLAATTFRLPPASQPCLPPTGENCFRQSTKRQHRFTRRAVTVAFLLAIMKLSQRLLRWAALRVDEIEGRLS